MTTERRFRVEPIDDPFGLVEADPVTGPEATKAIYLQLDTRDGEIGLGTRSHAENAVPINVYHGIVRRYYLPQNVDAKRLTDDINSGVFDDLFRRIVDGSEVVWDGQNHVCRMTDDAYAADQELSERLMDYPYTHEGVISARDWLREAYETGDLGLTAETTDEELEALAERLDAEAREEGIKLLHTLETLEEWRDELREREDA